MLNERWFSPYVLLSLAFVILLLALIWKVFLDEPDLGMLDFLRDFIAWLRRLMPFQEGG